MPTINSGLSVQVTVEIGQQYTITAMDSAVVEILSGSGWAIVQSVINLTGSQKSTTLGKYSNRVKINIRSISGSVEYSASKSVVYVGASRNIRQEDSGMTLDCASGVVLTIPPGLTNFGCAVRPVGVQVACGAGVTVNGASSTVTTTARVGAINPTDTANAYDVVGV